MAKYKEKVVFTNRHAQCPEMGKRLSNSDTITVCSLNRGCDPLAQEPVHPVRSGSRQVAGVKARSSGQQAFEFLHAAG